MQDKPFRFNGRGYWLIQEKNMSEEIMSRDTEFPGGDDAAN